MRLGESALDLFYSFDKIWLLDYRRELLAIFIVLALSFLYYQSFYSKNLEIIQGLDTRIISLKREIDALSKEVVLGKKRAETLKKIMEDFKRLEKRFLFTQNRLPSERQLSLILKELTKNEARGDIDFLSVRPFPLEDKKEYYRLPFRVDLEGPFFSMVRYIKQLEELPRIINVENLRIETSEGILPNVKVQLYASTFVLNTE